jgi:DNA-binding HxlR family transcriptional regulator
MILRDFFLQGPRRFQDLQDSFPKLSPNTLSARLKLLEEEGVLERQFYETHPPRSSYHLTEKGKKLGPVLKAMRDWGRAYE